MTKIIAIIASTVIGLISMSNSAIALDRRVEVVNNTRGRIVELAASPIDQNGWNYNMIAGSYIAAYSSIVADMDDGTGYCRYDLIAKFSDGTVVEKYDVNVCKIARWTINESNSGGAIRNYNRYQ